MQTTNFFAIGTLVLGLVLGGGAGWLLGQPGSDTSTLAIRGSDLPVGFREITLPDAGLRLAIRVTDQLANLKHEGKKIGYKIFDPYARGSGAQVDIILDRVEAFYDLPAATTLEAYDQAVPGITIQKSIDVNLNDLVGKKQLYSASLPQKRGDGAIIKRPVNGLLRYILKAPDGRIILLKTTGAFQTYLDTIATNLRFIPVGSGQADAGRINLGTDVEVDVMPESSSIELLNPATTLETD